MRIIKKGVLPEEIEYIHTCSRCNTVFAAKTSDRKHSPRNEPYVRCPVCGSYIDWDKSKPLPQGCQGINTKKTDE